jgi:hypothetical protein
MATTSTTLQVVPVVGVIDKLATLTSQLRIFVPQQQEASAFTSEQAAEAVLSISNTVQNAAESIVNATPAVAMQLIEGGAIETILNSVETVVKILANPMQVAKEADKSGQQLTKSIELFTVRLVTSSLGLNTSNNSSTASSEGEVHTDEAGLVAVTWKTVPDLPQVELDFDLDCTTTNMETFSGRLLVALEDLGVPRSAFVAAPEVVTCEKIHVVITVADQAIAADIEVYVASGEVAVANAFGIYTKARLTRVTSGIGISTMVAHTITLRVDGATAKISLPKQQQRRSQQQSTPTAGVMIRYASRSNTTDTLFPTASSTDIHGPTLLSPVVSVSLGGAGLPTSPVLDSNVEIKLPVQTRIESANTSGLECVWWDYGLSANNGTGGWSTVGCTMQSVAKVDSDQVVLCSCSHMTHFGVLFSSADRGRSEAEEKALRYITYIGMAVGLLGILLVWYCFATHRDLVERPELFILHLSVAIAVANTMFVAATDRNEGQSDESCAAVAVIIHYFLLATWTWQLCEAEHLHGARILEQKVLYARDVIGSHPQLAYNGMIRSKIALPLGCPLSHYLVPFTPPRQVSHVRTRDGEQTPIHMVLADGLGWTVGVCHSILLCLSGRLWR